MRKESIFCWHVRDEWRLRENLKHGFCDLYPQPQADKWMKRNTLSEGTRVRFCVTKPLNRHGCRLVVAAVTIVSKPAINMTPIDNRFPTRVGIGDIIRYDNPPSCSYVRGSHQIKNHYQLHPQQHH